MPICSSHTHMDTTVFYNPVSDVRLHAGHLTANDEYDLRGIIGTMLMKDPVFPVPSSLIEQACSFKDFFCGHVFELGDGIVIRTGKLNHPNGACGYRIEFQGKAIAICTDTEHYDDRIDENVVTLAKDADVMVYDSAYTTEEYPKFKGWGHSTWEKRSSGRSRRGQADLLFHHDPSHGDEKMDQIAKGLGSQGRGLPWKAKRLPSSVSLVCLLGRRGRPNKCSRFLRADDYHLFRFPTSDFRNRHRHPSTSGARCVVCLDAGWPRRRIPRPEAAVA